MCRRLASRAFFSDGTELSYTVLRHNIDPRWIAALCIRMLLKEGAGVRLKILRWRERNEDDAEQLPSSEHAVTESRAEREQ